MNRIFELSFNNHEEMFNLPINPPSFELSEGNLNKTVTLLNVGEITLIGNRGRIGCKLSSFFPSSRSPHYWRADREPMEYINTLLKWKNSKRPIRFIISDSEVNLAMALENITYSKREGDDDVYYTLDMSEYRFLNVRTVQTAAKAAVDTGLKERPNTEAVPKKYTVKDGDDLWTLAVRFYNDGAKYMKIYEANKNVMSSPNLLLTGWELVIPA